MNYIQRNLIVAISLVLGGFLLCAQESTWEWSWGKSASTHGGSHGWMEVIHCDSRNNSYGRVHYDTELNFSDTSFLHPNHLFPYGNTAICSYNESGMLVRAIDLYGASMGYVFSARVGTDLDLNLYLGLVFDMEVHINDTVFINEGLPMTIPPDILLAKVNTDEEVIWGSKITSPNQDELIGMITTDDGHSYVAGWHMANMDPVQLDILGQDLTKPYDHNLNTILKVGPEGNLVWKEEIRSIDQGTRSRDFVLGLDGYLHILGQAINDFSIGTDTFYHPGSPENNFLMFLLKFTQEGTFEGGTYYEDDLFITEIMVDGQSDYYFAGFIEDTASIGNDVIIVPEEETWWIIGKFDQALHPVWYDIVKGVDKIKCDLENRNVIFTASGMGLVEIDDTIVDLGPSGQNILVGELKENGDLQQLIRTESHHYMEPFETLLDRRKDILVSGRFKGTVELGPDTLNSFNYSVWDAFLTKISRYEPVDFDLGPDTTITIRDTLNLSIEDQYRSYLWSDGSIEAMTTIIADELGEGKHPVWLTATDGPYSSTDTIQLTIIDDSGLNDHAVDKLTVYPNPFTEFIIISCEADHYMIEVYDINGLKCFVKEINNINGEYTLHITDLKPGIYFLRITHEDKSYTRKIVKQ